MDQTSKWLIALAGTLIWPKVDLSAPRYEAVNGQQRFVFADRWVKVITGKKSGHYKRSCLFFESCPKGCCQGVLVAYLPTTNVVKLTPRVHFQR